LNDVFIEKFNLTTQKFNWEKNNIKLPELSNDDICYIEISEENLEKYNNYFNNINNNLKNIEKKPENNNKKILKEKEIKNEINKTLLNNLNNNNKTFIIIPKNNSDYNNTFIDNKKNLTEKKSFFIKDEKYENLTFFSFNILKSTFSKGLNLFNKIIVKSNSTIDLNINKQKKDSLLLSFLGINSKLLIYIKYLIIFFIFINFYIKS
jgi:hypothetical protein